MSTHKISRSAPFSKGEVGSEPSWVRSHWSQAKAGELKYHSPLQRGMLGWDVAKGQGL